MAMENEQSIFLNLLQEIRNGVDIDTNNQVV
jgi:hypothetical protein